MAGRPTILLAVLLASFMLLAGCAAPQDAGIVDGPDTSPADATDDGAPVFCDAEELPVAPETRDDPEPEVDDLLAAYALLQNATDDESFTARHEALLALAAERLRESGADEREIEALTERSRAANEAFFALVAERQAALQNLTALAASTPLADLTEEPDADAEPAPECLPLLGATGRGGAKSIHMGKPVKIKTNAKRWLGARGDAAYSHEAYGVQTQLRILPAESAAHYELRYGDVVFIETVAGEKYAVERDAVKIGGTPTAFIVVHPHPMLDGAVRGKVVSSHDAIGFQTKSGLHMMEYTLGGITVQQWTDKHAGMYFKIDDVATGAFTEVVHLESAHGRNMFIGDPHVGCRNVLAGRQGAWADEDKKRDVWSTDQIRLVRIDERPGDNKPLRYGSQVTMGVGHASGRFFLIVGEDFGWNCPTDADDVHAFAPKDGRPYSVFVLVDPDDPTNTDTLDAGSAVAFRHQSGWLRADVKGEITVVDRALGEWERWTAR